MADLTKKFDVLVIGGGNAALCAAISARRAGASVLVLEGAPKFYRGGNTRHTRNMRCAHDAATEILTGPYTEEEFWDDLLRLTGGQTDEELAKFMIKESKDILNWIVEQGVRWQPSLGGTLSLGRTNSFFLGGGRAMLNALYLTAEKLGVEIRYDAEVIDLEIEDGMFLSAKLKQPIDGATEIRASALVAAAGGFEANIEWLKEYWGEAADNFLIRGTPYNRGSILKMLLDKGVQDIGDPTQCHAVAIDARAPKFDGGIITRHDFGRVRHRRQQACRSASMTRARISGRSATRSGADWSPRSRTRSPTSSSIPASSPASCRRCFRRSRARRSPNSPASSSSTLPRWKRPSPNSTPRCSPAPSTTPSSTIAAPKASRRRRRTGRGRSSTPPYLAYPVRPGITFTYLGTRVNRQSRMVMKDGKPSANMFAAGEIMAGNVLGKGYAAGIGMTIGSVFGRVAGREAAKNARN